MYFRFLCCVVATIASSSLFAEIFRWDNHQRIPGTEGIEPGPGVQLNDLEFQSGEYEDDVAMNSSWATGDWNGDGEFDSSDFVRAFQDRGYERGPRVAVSLVPEPEKVGLMIPALIGILPDHSKTSTRLASIFVHSLFAIA